MNIVFFGSSDFSLPSLKACLQTPHSLVMVITTPQQKQGRGLREQSTVVQKFCEEADIPFLAPDNLKDLDLIEEIKELKPDVFVVASYGKMIPADWLKITSRVCLNVHPSLLPKYRGAAPLNWPILNGDPMTGLSIAEVTPKLDSGDLFYQETAPIEKNTTSEELGITLSEKAYHALLTVLEQTQNKTLKKIPQIEADATYARKLTKEEGRIDWKKPAIEILRKIQGLLPWPTAFCTFREQPLQILKAALSDKTNSTISPGAITDILKDRGFEIQTGDGRLWIEKVKPAGKKEMRAMDFINGTRLTPGAHLES